MHSIQISIITIQICHIYRIYVTIRAFGHRLSSTGQTEMDELTSVFYGYLLQMIAKLANMEGSLMAFLRGSALQSKASDEITLFLARFGLIPFFVDSIYLVDYCRDSYDDLIRLHQPNVYICDAGIGILLIFSLKQYFGP